MESYIMHNNRKINQILSHVPQTKVKQDMKRVDRKRDRQSQNYITVKAAVIERKNRECQA